MKLDAETSHLQPALAGHSSTTEQGSNTIADMALKAAAAFWFLVALVGMWIFTYYVAAYFGPLILNGGLEGLAETHLPKGYIPGDIIGNLAMALHLAVAVIVMGFGPLQLVPQIRERAPVFHHWNGRIYLVSVVATSIAGIYMVMTRGTINGVGLIGLNTGIVFNAVLIFVFAALTVRYAIARKIDIHRRWAMRLFLTSAGVWFFRVVLMAWFIVTGGVGIDNETFTGPFLNFLAFGQYLVPLVVFELYWRVQVSASAMAKFVMAAGLFVLTGLMGLGIFAATMGMWMPALQG